MRKTFLFTIFLTLLLGACTPQSPRSTKKEGVTSSENNESSTDDSSDDSSSTDNTITSPNRWFATGVEVQGTLGVPSNSTASFYIRGSQISSYIANNSLQTTQFCTLVSFNTSDTNVKKHLRLRTIPTTLLGSSEIVLRVDVGSSSDNQSICTGTEYVYDTNGNKTTTLINDASSAFRFDEVCPTCTSPVISSNVAIYKVPFQESNRLTTTQIDTSKLKIQINSALSTTTDVNSCSDAQCQFEGYSCCLEGQCVTDGALRPPGSIDASKLSEALIAVASDSTRFRDYPTVYFVCSSNNVGDNGDDDSGDVTTDPVDEANVQLQKDILDYNCLQGTTTDCDPDLATVQQRTWQKCGCLMDPITNDPLDPRCPDYGLKVERDISNNITNVVCDIPPVETGPTPFQNLNITVSARTAPHRFYSTSGINYDDISEAPSGTGQEGTSFNYLNESQKTGPVSTDFEMNAILGSMSLALDKTIPAKVIDLELDQSYIISATGGFYTPCETCQKDPWFIAFTAHPEKQDGFGITWANYSTQRDAYGNNDTNANYEDLIFGRACWVPPTMVPWTHKAEANINDQRRNRLTAQAALYINGYQRDWYGFNKGALIGSFDGVKWFAVGNGRRVRSTSTKLFLAINAPFADLAQSTNYSVTVVQDIAPQSASDHDYHYDLLPTDSGQNPGGSCQYMHQCEVDADCVGKLGWEYTCAAVTDMKTNLPRFDADAKELENSELTTSSISQLIFNGLNGDSTKRCVYRGAGSLCKVDVSTTDISPNTDNAKKLLTCAPNFYCAPLNGNAFNKELERSPNEPSLVTFGQIASVLGRPKKYINASETLPLAAQNNILENARRYTSTATASDYGLCRPGRSTASNDPVVQQQTRNTANHVDHISQIGSCNAGEADMTTRVQSCPAFDSDGNFIPGANDLQRRLQNDCGAKVQNGSGESAFATIEVEIGNNLDFFLNTGLFEAKLEKNACYRRAGSVCHTNLDCTPNKFHADLASVSARDLFGNTKAELEFWKEELICGQNAEKPLLNFATLDEYYEYDLGQNRCCREITKDFTMYTEITGASGLRQNLAGYHDENEGLRAHTSPDSTDQTGRYSRYTNIDATSLTTTTVEVGVDDTNAAEETRPKPATEQWKIINQTGSNNCCGGGFIRKFADGTNDWSDRNRLNLSPENFACINYPEESYEEAPSSTGRSITEKNWLYYYSKLCFYPAYADNDTSYDYLIGCIQYNIDTEFVDKTALTYPVAIGATGAVNTSTKTMNFNPGDGFDGSGTVEMTQVVSDGVPYIPDAYQGNGYDNQFFIVRNHDKYDGSVTSVVDESVAMILPHYVRPNKITDFRVFLYNADGDSVEYSFNPQQAVGVYDVEVNGTVDTNIEVEIKNCSSMPLMTTSPYLSEYTDAVGVMSEMAFCLDTENGRNVLKFNIRPTGAEVGDPSNASTDPADQDLSAGDFVMYDWNWGYIEIDFAHNYPAGALLPGSEQYYEDALSTLELLGVPQVAHKPVVCNNSIDAANYDLIPNLYADSTIDDFKANSYYYEVNAAATDLDVLKEGRIHYTTDNSTINLTPVFSADEFKCCAKVGSSVTESTRCCSNFAVTDPNNAGKFICKVKSGTNLNVYLNKFISSESDTGDDDTKLEDDDFDAETGFPKYTDEIYSKIRTFAAAHCENGGTRTGGAFGEYITQPNSGSFGATGFNSYTSIVDSIFDYDANTQAGYKTFMEGYRWNNHYYCD